jgi:hypothetical protein
MALPAVLFPRFLARRHSLAPFVVTLRKRTLVTHSSWGPLSERTFSHDAPLQNSHFGPEMSRRSENAAQSCPCETEARSLCRQQWRVFSTGQDLGAGRSPYLDAALTAFMGIGIGEPQSQTILLRPL